MSLLTAAMSVFGALKGNKADKAKNKRAAEQFALDKKLADRQIDISKYIEDYAKQAAGMSSDVTDIYGAKTYFDPITKTYKSELGDVQRGIQDASDNEEMQRYLTDQGIRREGLIDFENMRDRSVRESDTALLDLNNFKRGIGRVDAGQIGSQIRGDRTRAINAGYDDAERAAQTLQTRTGSSAVGDALNELARSRVRAQAEIGSPELEGLQFAEGINQGREANLIGKYQMFGDEGRSFYEAGYQPSIYGAEALARIGDQQKFDLSKLDLAMGGSGQAASTIGNAATGLRQGFATSEGARIHAPGAKLWQGLAGITGQLEKDIGKAFGGM